MIGYLKKKQIFWNVIDKVSFLAPLSMFKKIPKEIIVEPTNFCNLRCPICPTHFAMKRKRGFIDIELYKSIVDEFLVYKIKPRISLDFSGEPLLNKDIDKFVEYAHKKGHDTYISTNATLLFKELSKKLIKAGLSSIHLCLDGFTKEAQESYRVGSDFDKVKKNIEDFILAKQDLGGRTYVTIQVLLTSFSENQIELMKEWAEKIGANAINLKSLSLGSYTTKEIKEKYDYLIPKNEKFRRKTTNIRKTICTAVENSALVYWNGDLGLCCIDFDNVVKMPNISNNGFIKTFLSDEVTRKRKHGFRKKFPLCQKCSLGSADFMGINIRFKS
jgi:MoaA/NifB/PqqE/SkfB family radical SAM enzyme